MKCVWCHRETAEPLMLGEFWKMYCPKCDAYGPNKETKAAAKSSWGRLLAKEERLVLKKLELTEKELDVLDMLKDAARVGKPRPTNRRIQEVLGVSRNMPTYLIASLAKKNHIKIEGTQHKQRIKIL